MDASDAKAVCECRLLGLELEGETPSTHPDVVGVGIGKRVYQRRRTDETVLKVYVDRKMHAGLLPDGRLIPQEVDGVPTDVEGVRQIHAWRPLPPVYQRRIRPAPGGVSLGHERVTAGTLGVLARGPRGPCLLSNNHILADENAARPGDAVLQPGPFDGGRAPRDAIAELSDFVELRADVVNEVDAAIATPYRMEDVSSEVLGIGGVRGSRAAEVGTRVLKFGRTSRLTRGEVVDVSATLKVWYRSGVLLFRNQIVIKGARSVRFSAGGDSGALVVDEEHHAVGLLSAGSPFVTISNPIARVEQALNVTVGG